MKTFLLSFYSFYFIAMGYFVVRRGNSFCLDKNTQYMRNSPTAQRINKIGPSQKEPKNVRMFFKCGNSTMLFTKMDHILALKLEHLINNFMREHNGKLEGHFIHTK